MFVLGPQRFMKGVGREKEVATLNFEREKVEPRALSLSLSLGGLSQSCEEPGARSPAWLASFEVFDRFLRCGEGGEVASRRAVRREACLSPRLKVVDLVGTR